MCMLYVTPKWPNSFAADFQVIDKYTYFIGQSTIQGNKGIMLCQILLWYANSIELECNSCDVRRH